MCYVLCCLCSKNILWASSFKPAPMQNIFCYSLPPMGRFLPILGRSWVLLGRSWAALGRSCRSWGALGRSWAPLGRSWAALRTTCPNHPKIDSKSDRFGPAKACQNDPQIDTQIHQKSIQKTMRKKNRYRTNIRPPQDAKVLVKPIENK